MSCQFLQNRLLILKATGNLVWCTYKGAAIFHPSYGYFRSTHHIHKEMVLGDLNWLIICQIQTMTSLTKSHHTFYVNFQSRISRLLNHWNRDTFVVILPAHSMRFSLVANRSYLRYNPNPHSEHIGVSQRDKPMGGVLAHIREWTRVMSLSLRVASHSFNACCAVIKKSHYTGSFAQQRTKPLSSLY